MSDGEKRRASDRRGRRPGAGDSPGVAAEPQSHADLREREARRREGAQRSAAEGTVDGDPAAVLPSVRDNPVRLAAGVLAVVVGVAVVADAGLVPQAAIDRLLGEYFSLGLAVGAGAAALFVLRRRFGSAQRRADTPAVEYRAGVTVPGTDLDADLRAARSGFGGTRLNAKQRVYERLRAVAVDAYARREGVGEATARAAVENGDWTDDAVARTFLSSGGAGRGGVAADVRSLLTGESPFADAADRVVSLLAELTPGSAGDGAAGTVEAGDRPRTDDTTREAPVPADRRTDRWRGVSALALVMVALGVYATRAGAPPSLVVGAGAVVGAAGYVYLASPPAVTVAVERRVSDPAPDPGDEVVVTVTVRNTGDGTLPDLRLVDGVPPALLVTRGTPRHAAALRPGEATTFEYAVRAARGDHAFEPMQVLARDVSGAVERERYVDGDGATAVSCGLALAAETEMPVHATTGAGVGRVVTDRAGSGVQFHSVREYRRGDPLSRVDWNRLARTGEFATLEFHEEHAATVVLLVDARPAAYVAPRVDAPAALEWELAAADVVLDALVDAGDRVGLAALSPEWCWLEPRGGQGQRARARRLLERHPAFDATRPADPFHGGLTERRLRTELPDAAQLVLFSPLCDDTAATIARDLHARGHPVTVVSPDVTGGETTGQRLVAVERALRVSALRGSAVRVVDWDPADPLESALERAQRRWSR